MEKNLDSKKGNEKKKKSADERFATAMEVLFDGINPVELSEMVDYFQQKTTLLAKNYQKMGQK